MGFFFQYDTCTEAIAVFIKKIRQVFFPKKCQISKRANIFFSQEPTQVYKGGGDHQQVLREDMPLAWWEKSGKPWIEFSWA